MMTSTGYKCTFSKHIYICTQTGHFVCFIVVTDITEAHMVHKTSPCMAYNHSVLYKACFPQKL